MICMSLLAYSPSLSPLLPKGVELGLEDTRVLAVVADLFQLLLNRAGQQLLRFDLGHLGRGRRMDGWMDGWMEGGREGGKVGEK